MTRGAFAPFLHFVRTRRRSADADVDLLARFAADRDEDAFAELVRRHSPLVWGVVRQVLGHDQDAEDAFQATFLLLARKAGSVRTAAAGWLHATAWRIANRAKVRKAARRGRESSALCRTAPDPVAEAALRELQTLLHEEVAALPAKYRTPFVLCVLEGRGRSTVAAALGWNEGTVSSRLAWARRRLRIRLARRGVDVAAALAAIEIARDAKAAIPAALANATVTVARTGLATAGVAALAHGGFMTTKFAPLAALGILLGTIAAGSAGLMGSDSPATADAPKAKAPPQVAIPPLAVLRKGTCPVTVTGVVTGPNGQPVAGVAVYLTKMPHLSEKPFATAITDSQGQYAFKDLAMSMSRVIMVSDARRPNEPSKAYLTIQVSCAPTKLALAWHEETFFEIHTIPPAADRHDEPRYASDPATVNLTPGQPSRFQGRLVDDHGQPVADASIRMTRVDHLLAPPLPVLQGILHGALPTECLPDSRTTATTGRDGRFHIDGVPTDAIARFSITHPDYATLSTTAALIDPRSRPPGSRVSPLIPRSGASGLLGNVLVGDLNLTLTAPRPVTVEVVSSTTGKPVPNAHVSIGPRRAARTRGIAVVRPPEPPKSHASGTTDAAGKLTLKMPPGSYTLLAYAPDRVPPNPAPPNSTYFGRQETPIEIKDEADQPLNVRLDPACAIQLEVVDAETGKPIADQTLHVEVERGVVPGQFIALPGRPGRQGPAVVNWVHVDGEPIPTPRTDAAGRATTWANPGTGRARVNLNRASDYADFTTAEPVILAAGSEVKLQVELRKKGPPAPPPQPPPQPPPPPPQAARPKSVPVTVAGTVTGPDGKPVAGANVYLIAKDGPHEPLIATTTTDDQGAYEFRDAQMLVTTIGVTPSLPVVVHLQVCAAKPGLALAWHQRAFSVSVLKPVQTQRIKLTLGKPVEHPGRVLDAQGRPVAGAKVRLRGDFGAIIVGDLPDAVVATRTGPDGRFRLTGVPDVLVQVEVIQPGFPDVQVFAVSPRLAERYRTDPNLPAYRLAMYQIGEINVTLPSPRLIPVRVVANSTGAPVKGVDLTMSSDRDARIRLVSRGTTDADGRAVLRQPPGTYQLEMIMPVGTNYLNIPEKVTVQPEPAEQPLAVRLMDGCTVEIEAVDVATGIPLANVHIVQSLADKSNVRGSMYQYARGRDGPDLAKGSEGTDPWGKLTTVLPPGKYLFRPMTPFVAMEDSKPIDLPDGGTIKLRIAVREIDLKQRP